MQPYRLPKLSPGDSQSTTKGIHNSSQSPSLSILTARFIFIAKYPGDITWQELEARLLDILDSINAAKHTSFSYFVGENFYFCDDCMCHVEKNKYTAAAEVFCCGVFEDVREQSGFQLNNGCVLYDAHHASRGKPKKFKTLPKKTKVDGTGVDGPDKVDMAVIRNAVWRSE